MNKLWYIGGTVVAVAVVGFGYWTISPFFRNIEADEPMPFGTVSVDDVSGTNMAVQSETVNEERSQSVTAPPPSTMVSVNITDTPAHPASGRVKVVEASGTTYIRYENLKTINGPDLYVYLAKDLDAKEFVNLGRIKATEGNVNYAVPTGVHVSEYRYVLIWCRAFSVLFNYADLKV